MQLEATFRYCYHTQVVELFENSLEQNFSSAAPFFSYKYISRVRLLIVNAKTEHSEWQLVPKSGYDEHLVLTHTSRKLFV